MHFICMFLSTDAQMMTVHLRVSVLAHNEGNEAILEALSNVSTNNVHIHHTVTVSQKNIINGPVFVQCFTSHLTI